MVSGEVHQRPISMFVLSYSGIHCTCIMTVRTQINIHTYIRAYLGASGSDGTIPLRRKSTRDQTITRGRPSISPKHLRITSKVKATRTLLVWCFSTNKTNYFLIIVNFSFSWICNHKNGRLLWRFALSNIPHVSSSLTPAPTPIDSRPAFVGFFALQLRDRSLPATSCRDRPASAKIRALWPRIQHGLEWSPGAGYFLAYFYASRPADHVSRWQNSFSFEFAHFPHTVAAFAPQSQARRHDRRGVQQRDF